MAYYTQPHSFEYDDVTPPPAIYHHPPPQQASLDPYYLHHQYPPPQLPPPAIAGASSDIHTLFIAGLPDDVLAREIHNLFRRRSGFDSCLLEYTGKGNQAVAFAKFVNHQAAVAAMTELNGSIFDPATGATLHIELAKSNSRRRPLGESVYDIYDKRGKAKKDKRDIPSDAGNGGSQPGEDILYTGRKGAATQSGSGKNSPTSVQAASKDQPETTSSENITPCSTLFIANLSLSCTEEQLKQILEGCRGFQALKWQKTGKPCAFVDFEDDESSTEAKEKLRGTLTHAADDEGLYVEYAKSKMRNKRGL